MKNYLFDFIFGLVAGCVAAGVDFLVIRPGSIALLPWFVLAVIAFFAYTTTARFRKRLKENPRKVFAWAFLAYAFGLAAAAVLAGWFVVTHLWSGALL